MTLPSISEEEDEEEEEEEEHEDNERTLLSPTTTAPSTGIPTACNPGVVPRTNRLNLLAGIGRSHTVAAIGNNTNSGSNTPTSGSQDRLLDKLPERLQDRLNDRLPDRLQDRLQDRLPLGSDCNTRYDNAVYYVKKATTGYD